MKKYRLIAAALLTAGMLTGCGSQKNVTAETNGETSAAETEVSVDYGKSSLFSKDDIDQAAALLMKEFSGWEGCEMHKIRFTGDECNSADNIAWINQLKEGQNYTQCLILYTDFHSPKEAAGAWEADKEYLDYSWVFGRKDGGEWELLNWGY